MASASHLRHVLPRLYGSVMLASLNNNKIKKMVFDALESNIYFGVTDAGASGRDRY